MGRIWPKEQVFAVDGEYSTERLRVCRRLVGQIQTEPETMATVCKHPRVRIVSRHDDIEFVECLECGEVFDSEEFRDMEIEETVQPEQAESEP
jgi:hypothetical protein